jgi:hypothetical protein
MVGHQGVMLSDTWLTPWHVIEDLGPFDLDPCASVVRPWPTAAKHYTKEDDGLSQRWEGRVWLNPPYGRYTSDWLERLAQHGKGTALIFARTETIAWRDHVWTKASSVLFLFGRLRFCREDGKGVKGAGAPSALVSYGASDAETLRTSRLGGAWVPLQQLTDIPQQRWLPQWRNPTIPAA